MILWKWNRLRLVLMVENLGCLKVMYCKWMLSWVRNVEIHLTRKIWDHYTYKYTVRWYIYIYHNKWRYTTKVTWASPSLQGFIHFMSRCECWPDGPEGWPNPSGTILQRHQQFMPIAALTIEWCVYNMSMFSKLKYMFILVKLKHIWTHWLGPWINGTTEASRAIDRMHRGSDERWALTLADFRWPPCQPGRPTGANAGKRDF
jgi:hypothetical protein